MKQKKEKKSIQSCRKATKKNQRCSTEKAKTQPEPSAGLFDYVGKCKKKTAAKMKKLKRGFDFDPSELECSRNQTLSSCTKADLKMMEKIRRAHLKKQKQRKKDKDDCKKAAMIARRYKKTNRPEEYSSLCCDSDYRAGICDIANRILKEDDIDYADSECDYFPCKGNYAFPNSESLRHYLKKKKHKKPRCVPLESACSASSSEALRPRKGVAKNRRMHKLRYYNYRYPSPYVGEYCNACHCKKRPAEFDYPFVPDDWSYYSKSKHRYPPPEKRHKKQRKNQDCLVCPLGCPYHTGNRDKSHKHQKHSRKKHSSKRLNYSHLIDNDKFAPEFAFGHRQKSKRKKHQKSSKKRETHPNHYKHPHQRRTKYINPFLPENYSHSRKHMDDGYEDY